MTAATADRSRVCGHQPVTYATGPPAQGAAAGARGRGRGVRPVELLAGSLTGACLAVPSPDDGACRTCHGDVDRPAGRRGGAECAGAECAACRAVAAHLGRPPIGVTPVSLTTTGSGLHQVLATYKAPGPGAGRDARRIAALMSLFVRRHLGCVAPAGADAVLAVPSLGGRRPPPHPLHGVLGLVDGLPPLLDCLVPGDSPVGRRRAARDGVACTRSLAGLHVLLVDDTYASGARLQSAGAAATAAGATVVGGLVVGRFVRGRRPSGEALLSLARSRPWDPARCAACGAGP